MTALHRRFMWITLGVLAAAGIIGVVVLQWKQGRPATSTAQPGISASPGPLLSYPPDIPPEQDAEKFAHLPPAERINAETKARMARNAAIREKLRQGDYSTLPSEALPTPALPPSPKPGP